MGTPSSSQIDHAFIESRLMAESNQRPGQAVMGHRPFIMFSALSRASCALSRFRPGLSVKALLIVAAHIARWCGPSLFHPVLGGCGPFPAVHAHIGDGTGKERWLVVSLDDIISTIPAAVSRHRPAAQSIRYQAPLERGASYRKFIRIVYPNKSTKYDTRDIYAHQAKLRISQVNQRSHHL
jgi:hypothetical protein